MKIQKKLIGGLILAATFAMTASANAQAVRLNLGNVGVTALGGGSLANVNLGAATAVVNGTGGGLNANINIAGLSNPGIPSNPTTPTTPGTPTLGVDNFFAGNQISISGGGGSGAAFGSGLTFGDNGSANATVNASDARRRVVAVGGARKLIKRRVVRAVASQT